jgi:putative hydrolase of the HAD superfamily
MTAAGRDVGHVPETVRGVLVDYGGVLTTPTRDSIRDWTRREGLDPQSFSRVLKAWLSRSAPAGNPLHQLETGTLAADEFNHALTPLLRSVDGGPVPQADHLGGIFATMEPEPRMIALLEQLAACGIRLALVSNSWGNPYPPRVLELFDVVVISGEVGLRKPQPEIYLLALERLGIGPHEAVLVDDGSPNIEAAELLGLTGILHTDPGGTLAALARLVPQLREDAGFVSGQVIYVAGGPKD